MPEKFALLALDKSVCAQVNFSTVWEVERIQVIPWINKEERVFLEFDGAFNLIFVWRKRDLVDGHNFLVCIYCFAFLEFGRN